MKYKAGEQGYHLRLPLKDVGGGKGRQRIGRAETIRDAFSIQRRKPNFLCLCRQTEIYTGK